MLVSEEPNRIDDSFTMRLAGYASGLTYEDLPQAVQERVKYLILDGFGCGIHGSSLPWSEILTESILALGSDGQVAGWGMGRYLSGDHAALLNGSFVQAFELDDYSRGGALHACALVLPAALAASAVVGRVTGRDLIAATVAGFEVGNRVGKFLGATRLTTLGWHTGSVIGPLAAAAGAGNILGLDDRQMAHAFGIAATQASGLMAAGYGSMVKRMHHGRASQSGLYGAILASNGYTGIEAVFEQPYAGYGSTFTYSEDGFDLQALVAGLGEDYRTLGTCIKPYACCAKIHVALDAVRDARLDRPFEADEVAQVRVRCTKATMKKTGWVYTGSGSATEAQMNLGYGIAVMLLEGDAFVDQYREELLTDPRVLDLTHKITVVNDESFDALGEGRRHHIHVEVELTDGSVIAKELDFALGSHNRPLENEDILDKFDKLVSGRNGSAEPVKDAVLELDALGDVGELQTALAES